MKGSFVCQWGRDTEVGNHFFKNYILPFVDYAGNKDEGREVFIVSLHSLPPSLAYPIAYDRCSTKLMFLILFNNVFHFQFLIFYIICIIN